MYKIIEINSLHKDMREIYHKLIQKVYKNNFKVRKYLPGIILEMMPNITAKFDRSNGTPLHIYAYISVRRKMDRLVKTDEWKTIK